MTVATEGVADNDRRRLKGHHVVVAGAAAGIGRATALALAAENARVTCLDTDEERLASLASDLDARGGDHRVEVIDVTDARAVGRLLPALVQRTGQIHALVNCVGITGTTNLRSHEVDLADFTTVLRVNVVGAFNLSQAILPLMLPHGYGRILHLASVAGKEGNAGMVSYSTSKAALIGMVKSQGKEYATDGITVNALAPGVIRTDLVARMPPQQVEYMTSRIPVGRCATLDEVADMILWIISPAASFTTGFTYDLSGGRATY
ncbi:MAG: SDR family NAD(P)-dependent oxidoreductase [Actinocatenispora sp.]